MKTLSLKVCAFTALVGFSLASMAQENFQSAEFRAAMDKCRSENPAPARPQAGQRPTQEQRSQFESHMEAMKTCMQAAGFKAPDRPPRHHGQRPPPRFDDSGSSGTGAAQ
ncbi:MAG: hypothetical protein KF799_12485 [Bdellovibrionales bacterium]|nr:hypothetical protein [Bdellovibrionales bacterium]